MIYLCVMSIRNFGEPVCPRSIAIRLSVSSLCVVTRISIQSQFMWWSVGYLWSRGQYGASAATSIGSVLLVSGRKYALPPVCTGRGRYTARAQLVWYVRCSSHRNRYHHSSLSLVLKNIVNSTNYRIVLFPETVRYGSSLIPYPKNLMGSLNRFHSGAFE